MKSSALALLLVGLCFGEAAAQAKDWPNTPFAEVKQAAEQGETEAQYYLGWRYYAGKGIPENFNLAVIWFRRAADQGFPDAQHVLGMLYIEGKDYRQAEAWFRRAAEQEFPDAQLKLGEMYLSGNGGLPQDYKLASIWFRKAAEQGNPTAQNNLGVMYERGDGLPQDYKMSYVWYSVAAANGYSEAVAFRNNAAKELSPAVLSDAQTLAGQYFEKYQPKQ